MASSAAESHEIEPSDRIQQMLYLLAQGRGRKAYANNESTVLTVPQAEVGDKYVVLDGGTRLPRELDDRLLVAKVYRKPDSPDIDDI